MSQFFFRVKIFTSITGHFFAKKARESWSVCIPENKNANDMVRRTKWSQSCAWRTEFFFQTAWVTAVSPLLMHCRYQSCTPSIYPFKSLWPSDTISRHRSGSTLAEVMARVMAPSHYLNQYWFILSRVLWHLLEDSSTENNPEICHWDHVFQDHTDGLVQERRNSIANALELRLSCTNPMIQSKYYSHISQGPMSSQILSTYM